RIEAGSKKLKGRTRAEADSGHEQKLESSCRKATSKYGFLKLRTDGILPPGKPAASSQPPGVIQATLLIFFQQEASPTPTARTTAFYRRYRTFAQRN
ncbi:hypothetical protein V5799_030445, partial [Amblyomma americanum]